MKAQHKLRNKEVIEIEGLFFEMDGDGEVRPGDTYIAERNLGPQLLTCREITDYKAELFGLILSSPWVTPMENAYPYDVGECVRVRMVED